MAIGTRRKYLHNKKNIKKRKLKFTKKNCSPIMKGKTVHKNSCLTSNVMFNLKKQYNHKYPEDPIRENTPASIWKLLKKKMTTCQSEDCLLYTSPSPRDGLLSRMPSSA